MPYDDQLIDRHSARPYYQQMVDSLAERIDRGTHAPGQRLPSENDLCVEYGLSRATVRQALQVLESQRLVERIPGRGVYVAEPAQEKDRGWIVQGSEGFLEDVVGHQNRSVTTIVLRAEHVPLPQPASSALGLPKGSPGFALVRVRSVDGVPALFSTNYFPPAVEPIVAAAPDVLSGSASLTELLSDAGYLPGGAHRIIHSLKPTDEVTRQLDVSADFPMLRVRSTSWDLKERRYDFYETWLRTDVVPVEINVSAVAQPRGVASTNGGR
jgi:GntR family transcriptional regulator